MASIEKQTIFEIFVGDVDKITIDHDGDWVKKVPRNWGWNGKTVNRYLFRLKGGHDWFECSEEMGKDILGRIPRKRGLKEVDIVISTRVKENLEVPEQDKKFINMWNKFKGLFKRS